MLQLKVSRGQNSIEPTHPKLIELKKLLHQSSKLNITIEGNIGAGKTTLLKYLKQLGTDQMLTFREPLEKWTDFHGSNLLDLVYRDTSTWIFPFQSYALLTMLQNHTKEINERIKIMERSIFSARYCFIEAHVQKNNIDSIRFEILKQWYEFIMEKFQIQIDLVIYVRTTPLVLLQRIKKRNRPEEQNIEMDYLELLHEKHDDWLLKTKFPLTAKLIVLNGDNTREEILIELESKLLEWNQERFKHKSKHL